MLEAKDNGRCVYNPEKVAEINQAVRARLPKFERKNSLWFGADKVITGLGDYLLQLGITNDPGPTAFVKFDRYPATIRPCKTPLKAYLESCDRAYPGRAIEARSGRPGNRIRDFVDAFGSNHGDKVVIGLIHTIICNPPDYLALVTTEFNRARLFTIRAVQRLLFPLQITEYSERFVTDSDLKTMLSVVQYSHALPNNTPGLDRIANISPVLYRRLN